jgi:hypothetical protein
MVLHEDPDSLVDTIELLSNPETIDLVKKVNPDIAAGRVKEISSVNDLNNDYPVQS